MLWLHDVLHQIVDVLIIHLLFRLIVLLLLHFIAARLLSLVIGTFLLGASMVHPATRVRVVVLRAILRQAPTITLCIVLHLPLMILELYAVIKDLITEWCAIVVVGLVPCVASFRIGALGGVITSTHLLLLLCLGLLLLAFELLLGDKLRAGVLVQIEVKRLSLIEVVVGLRDHRVTIRLDLFDLVQVLL